jgi:hypothetical protein
MDRYERLNFNIYGLDLHYGKIAPVASHSVEIFYIVEHTDDKEFIKKEALQMLQQFGQSYYHFFGSKEPLWHLIFDETDMILNSTKESIAMTCGYDSLEEFINEIEEKKHFRPFVSCDYYLIYDDKAIYKKIKQELNL